MHLLQLRPIKEGLDNKSNSQVGHRALEGAEGELYSMFCVCCGWNWSYNCCSLCYCIGRTLAVAIVSNFFRPSLAHPLRFFLLVPLAVDKLNNRAEHRALAVVVGESSSRLYLDCILSVCILLLTFMLLHYLEPLHLLEEEGKLFYSFYVPWTNEIDYQLNSRLWDESGWIV